jgi:pimeloyl-ACP methyl ester carboxylesterase
MPSAVSRPPRTGFARSGDATIAYQVAGDGPLDVVFAHGWFSHLEVGWEEPRYARFLHRLARGRRLILMDRRACIRLSSVEAWAHGGQGGERACHSVLISVA